MTRWLLAALAVAVASCTPPPAPGPTPAPSAGGDLRTLPQGWSPAQATLFQTTPQGSYLIPLPWFRALRRPDSGERFAADQLQRYGYLPSGAAGSALPIGFVQDGAEADPYLGMTCAACHTGRITYRGTAWRIDGGRANADFQAFLTDLGAAARATLDDPSRFDLFAAEALGAAAAPSAKTALRADLASWTDSYTQFMRNSLPAVPWGPGRLDAFGMIFNRATALDLGLPQNFAKADAPVRYPFIWDAPRQDLTQWTGAAPNGTYVRALARNTGEVFGVFGRFHPAAGGPRGAVYCNLVDRDGLQTLEQTLVRLRAPRWPAELFGLDPAKAARGSAVFAEHCAGCHGLTQSTKVRNAWNTPLVGAGTDPRTFNNANADGDTGVLAGTQQPPIIGDRLGARAPKARILANAVLGSLLDDLAIDGPLRTARACPANLRSRHDHAITRAAVQDVAEGRLALAGMPTPRAAVAATSRDLYPVRDPANAAKYEARVLTGIWAVGPYLHNGSVPTLWELLKPPRERMTRFPVGGEEFDPVQVGPDPKQHGRATFVVDPAVGNGNGGHEWGTTLPDAAKWDLIEYLKGL